MNANDVSVARDLGGRCFVFNTQLAGTFGRQTAAPGNHGHAKSARTGNHFSANPSDTNETESSAKQSPRFGKLLLLPFAAAYRNYIVGNPPVERENQRKGQFGHRY